MKRRVAILLLVAMLLSLVSIIGLTEGGDRFVSGDYAYLILPDGTAEITAFSKSYSGGTLTIPSELAGHRVTSIGAQAFFGRENLTEIVIPEGVTNIGDYAFEECLRLTRIALPDSLTTIGANPFVSCRGLTEIALSSDHPVLIMHDGVLFSKPDKRLVCYPYTKQHIKTITDSTDLFYGGQEIEAEYDIPKGTEIIGDGAFRKCEGLSRTSIPGTVTRIGRYAFAETALESIEIPDSVTSIGDLAFYSTNVEKVSIPDSVTEIGANPFAGCEDLTSIKASKSNPTLGSKDGVLYSIPDRRLVAYPAGKEASKYDVPQGADRIGDYAFYQADVASVILPDSVTEIGDYGLYLAGYDVASITVPASVTSIGESALGAIFDFGDFLTIKVESGSYAESYCRANDLKYQNGQGVVYKGTEIYVPEEEEEFTDLGEDTIMTEDRFLYEIRSDDTIEITGYLGPLMDIVIPASIDGRPVRSIGEEAFSWAHCNRTELESVVIPEGVTKIGVRAFWAVHSIREISLPSTIAEIEDQAFTYCTGLTALVIPDGVTSLGEDVFLGSENLMVVTGSNIVKAYCEQNGVKCE